MSKSSRTKGHAYEREVRQAFEDAGFHTLRNLEQTRNGGADLLPVLVWPFSFQVECKRRARLPFLEWVAQVEAVTGDGKWRVPTVVCRADRGQSHVVLRLSDFLSILQRLHDHAVPEVD